MEDCTKLSIALAGQHADAFVKALQVEDIFEIQYCSIDDAIGRSVAVLALAGEGFTFCEADIDRMIQSGTVLALFNPSQELLETVHRATNTPIDIPNLTSAEGLPLLIYSANGTVHIAPNNSRSKVEIQGVISDLLEKEHCKPAGDGKRSFEARVLTLTPAEHCIRSISRAVTASRSLKALVTNLDPPAGVIGFKKGTLDNSTTISITWLAWRRDGQYSAQTTDPSLIQRYDFNWYTDFYAYATGADCRNKSASDFTREGGVVYTVAIERGSLRRTPGGPPRFLGPTSGYCGYYFVDFNQTGTHGGSSMRMVGYEPKGLDSESGKMYNYSIDFQQEMQMFNNNGNGVYTFNARYLNSFGRDRFQQHAVQDSSGVDYSVDYKDYYDHWSDPDFKTDTWWNPGVFEEVHREGWKHWIVREYLPADNIPIHSLTVFSSSVGKHSLTSKRQTIFRAFKSSAWRTTSDDNTTHKQRTAIRYHNGNGYSRTLDLTWSA